MKPSWTAQGAVAQRAVLTRRGVLDDPWAQGMLTGPMAIVSRLGGIAPRVALRRAVTLAGFAGLELWIDDRLGRALDEGVHQVAVVGAGLDARAWRLGRDGVVFFELDHAASQRAKVEVAPGPGVRWVTADLRREDASSSLIGAGLRIDAPALVVVQSVTMYLTEATVRRQLERLADDLGPGSRLLVNFQPSSPPPTARTRRQLRLQRLARAGSGEGFTFTADPGAAQALVESTGWAVTERTGGRSAARALVPASAGLPVDAVDESKTLIAGRLAP